MCNACGFYCCAFDDFSGCGCDACPEPACWPEDEDDYYDEDYDDYEAAPRACTHSRFRCVEVQP